MNDFESWFRKAEMLAEHLEGISLEPHETLFLELYEKGYTPRQAVEGFIQDFL